MSKSLIAAAACGAALVLAASSASAERPEFCRDYARAALTQVRIALHHPRCDWRMEHNPARWSSDYRAHFDWCRGASRDQAMSERDARTRMLERCTDRGRRDY